MSVMGSDDQPETYDERLQAALVAMAGCIGESLDDLCSYGLTIGETYVPFDPDPEDEDSCDEGTCSQAWVRVMAVNPKTVPSFAGSDCSVELEIDLEIGVIRCIEVPAQGEAPTATDVLVAAMQAITDMNRIHCAAMDCDVWESIESGQWSPAGPLGGQYGGTWTFTVVL